MQKLKPSTLARLIAACVFIVGLAGCGSTADATRVAAPESPSIKAATSREKVVGQAGIDTAAQAMGGSGMPGPNGASAASGLKPGQSVVDAPPNPAAQAAGGSGMPGPN